MDKWERFVISCVYKDNTTDLLVGSFDTICNYVERRIYKDKNDDERDYLRINIIDRECGAMYYIDNENNLDSVLYSQFIDSYYGDENI